MLKFKLNRDIQFFPPLVCFQRARRGHLLMKQRDCAFSIKKIIQTTSTSPGGERMWNQARVTQSPGLRWLTICINRSLGWEEWQEWLRDTTTLTIQVWEPTHFEVMQTSLGLAYFFFGLLSWIFYCNNFCFRAAPWSTHSTHYSQNRSAPWCEAWSEARRPSFNWQQPAKHWL